MVSLLQQPLITYLILPLIVSVLGSLIVYYIFGIGKQKKEQKVKSVAILNSGKRNTFNNNTVIGYDVGIEDNGKETIAIGNKIYGKSSTDPRTRWH